MATFERIERKYNTYQKLSGYMIVVLYRIKLFHMQRTLNTSTKSAGLTVPREVISWNIIPGIGIPRNTVPGMCTVFHWNTSPEVV